MLMVKDYQEGRVLILGWGKVKPAGKYSTGMCITITKGLPGTIYSTIRPLPLYGFINSIRFWVYSLYHSTFTFS